MYAFYTFCWILMNAQLTDNAFLASHYCLMNAVLVRRSSPRVYVEALNTLFDVTQNNSKIHNSAAQGKYQLL